MTIIKYRKWPQMNGRGFALGERKTVPFWLGDKKNDPEEIAKIVEERKKWEAMTTTCRFCGKVALYRVNMIGYCKEHHGEALRSARAAKGLK